MDNNHPINVLHPRRLPLWRLPAERQALGITGDYKPTLAMLPDGEIVMAALYSEIKDGEFREYTPFWRSKDGGKTWSQREILQDVLGREQWLTATSKGTLFMSSHFLHTDAANDEGIIHSFIHRSVDGGRSWQRTKIFLQGDERCGVNMAILRGGHTSRNVVELDDGTLLFGVSIGDSSVAYMWRSTDDGQTWDHGEPVSIDEYNGKPYDNADGFFAEDFTFLTKTGKLLHWIRCGPPSPMYPMNDGRATPMGDDEGDRTLLCESTDNGRTWSNLQDFGDYGIMYIRVIRLRDGRLLMTYTRRSLLFPPSGLGAAFSYDDGETWELESDILILEGKTPWCVASGGGFGNTLELEDGTFVTAYTYRGADEQTHLEVMRWKLPVSDTRPFFFDGKLLETPTTILHDWSETTRDDVSSIDCSHPDTGKSQSVVTRGQTTIGEDVFDATLTFLSKEQTGSESSGLTFMNLPVTDFSDCLGIAIKIHNPSDKPEEMTLLVRNAKEGAYSRRIIPANASELLFLTIDEMISDMDTKSILDIILVTWDVESEHTFYVGPLYVVTPG